MTSASPTARAFGATCPEHSGFRPVETCSRCGRFLCARCETWGEFCATCEHRQLEALPSAASRGRWAQWALALVALSAVPTVALNGWLITQLHPATALSVDPSAYLWRTLLLDLPVIVASALAAFSFLRWLHLAVRTAKLLGLEPGTTPGWAVAWWFIPLAHLYDPYLVVRGLWMCLGGAHKKNSALSAWWTAWVLGGVTWSVKAYMLGALMAEPLHLMPALLSGFLTGVLITSGALICMRVIGQIQALIDECLDEVAEAA